MNDQLFFQKLAEKTNIKEAEVSIYIETFVFGFATELETFRKAGFDPFGIFEVEKCLEYVEQREDGSKVLCPPCLKVKFSPSAILGVLNADVDKEINPIYDVFALRYDWSKEATSLFIAQIKSVIKSQLLAYKQSVIPLFGTFEGELGGEIEFTPDIHFAELINKPFSHFQEVELSCSETELKNVAGLEPIVAKDSQNIPHAHKDAGVTSKTDCSALNQDDENKENRHSFESVEEHIDSLAESNREDNSSQDEIPHSRTEEKEVSTPNVDDRSIEESQDEGKEFPEKETVSAKDKAEGDDFKKTSLPHPKQLNETNTASDLNSVVAEGKLKEKLDQKDYIISYYKRLTLFLSIFLLAVLILWYWSSHLQVESQEEMTIVDTETVIPLEDESLNFLPKDSLMIDSIASQEPIDSISEFVESESSDPKTPTSKDKDNEPLAEKVITSEVIVHHMKAGETLRGLSLRYYNTKEKWTKILEANQDVIEDPDRVPVGTVLKIPKDK